MSDVKIDPRTHEGRKALSLMTVHTSSLIAALGLPERSERPDNAYYSKGALCLMAVNAGLTPKDFMK
ncbi:hypothetical protein DN603_15920 [Raoultella planticola]|uniref:Uncharacterized protein n=1 Tax=Raoultella planticola TaxID=575 RepID=A0A443VL48_RAOPL|nr:hypothetical protein DN603_15920 [Raoultella planticola]